MSTQNFIESRLSRRKWIGRSAAAAATLLSGGAAGADRSALSWRAGAGRREITPPLDVGILMSSGLRQWAPFEGVRLPLFARALVLDNGRSRVGLVALDLLGLAGEAVGGWDDFKRRVSAHAGDALAADQVVLASTHTHSGPESLALTDLCRTGPFRRWVQLLAEAIGAALKDAAGSLRPCRLVGGVAAAPGLSVNRRIRTARGITAARAVRPSDQVLGPEGPTDEQIRCLAFEDRAGRPIAILVNATTHPVYEMCIKQVSPDYPGELSGVLEERHVGATAIFLQGAAGNINPPQVSSGAADARRHGLRLADLVDQAIPGFPPIAGTELMLRWGTLRLPARTISGGPQAEPLVARIGALRIGRAALVFLSGEPFVEIGLAIGKASPFALTAVVAYAEDYIGYIPTDRAFRNGGYEIGPGRWSRVGPGSEAIVEQEAGRLLTSLARDV
jgi:hypothetical protein